MQKELFLDKDLFELFKEGDAQENILKLIDKYSNFIYEDLDSYIEENVQYESDEESVEALNSLVGTGIYMYLDSHSSGDVVVDSNEELIDYFFEDIVVTMSNQEEEEFIKLVKEDVVLGRVYEDYCAKELVVDIDTGFKEREWAEDYVILYYDDELEDEEDEEELGVRGVEITYYAELNGVEFEVKKKMYGNSISDIMKYSTDIEYDVWTEENEIVVGSLGEVADFIIANSKEEKEIKVKEENIKNGKVEKENKEKELVK